MLNYVLAAVFSALTLYNAVSFLTTPGGIASLFYVALTVVFGVLAGRRIMKIFAERDLRADETKAFYDRGRVTEGYQPAPGPVPPLPTTGSAVVPPMSQGWQVPQPSSALPHAPAQDNSINTATSMGIGALVGGVLGWNLGKSSETEETSKEPRAYRMSPPDAGVSAATGEPAFYSLPPITSATLDEPSYRASEAPPAVEEPEHTSFALPAIDSSELSTPSYSDNSSSYDSGSSSYDSGSSSYDSGSSSSYDSGSSSSD